MLEGVVDFIKDSYNIIASPLPGDYQIIVNLAFYIILIAIYAIIIWKFYHFLARRDLLQLHLRQYSSSSHPFIEKTLGSILYFLEYIVFLPILVFIWFGVLGFFLLMLSKNQSVSNILIISAGVVGAIRITSYFSEDLSKDLAKMFPFTILAVFLLDPSFFSLNSFLERIIEIPNFFNHILIYLVFIVFIEIIMRLIFLIIYFVFSFRKEEEEQKVLKVTKKSD